MDVMEIREGDFVKINIDKVKKYDSIPPYIKLVKEKIKNAENHMPLVSGVDEHFVQIRSWKFDFLGDVSVPRDSIVRVKKG